MLLSIFDSKLVDTFNELFEPSDLYKLKEFFDLRVFIIIGALMGYMWFLVSIIKIIVKSIKAFYKGFKG